MQIRMVGAEYMTAKWGVPCGSQCSTLLQDENAYVDSNIDTIKTIHHYNYFNSGLVDFRSLSYF